MVDFTHLSRIINYLRIVPDGYNYEKAAIESWLSSGKLTSPMTNDHLSILELVPNTKLQSQIMEFVRQSKE